MTYDLFVRLPSPTRRESLGQFLADRGKYTLGDSRIEYRNELTGVYFYLTARRGGLPLGGGRVRDVHFEINYGRPSYFALEADVELRALIDAFDAQIKDPQMKGMGAGPYTTEGFLRGWSFGNELLTSTLIRDGTLASHHLVPGAVLREAWEWNYRRGDRMKRLGGRQFLPEIGFWMIDGQLRRAVVWGAAMPTILPQVDHVLVGRYVDGEPRTGLVPWAQLIELVGKAGVDISKGPLDIHYEQTPELIAEWVANVQLIEPDGRISCIEPERLLDAEAVAGAQQILSGQAGVAAMTFESG